MWVCLQVTCYHTRNTVLCVHVRSNTHQYTKRWPYICRQVPLGVGKHLLPREHTSKEDCSNSRACVTNWIHHLMLCYAGHSGDLFSQTRPTWPQIQFTLPAKNAPIYSVTLQNCVWWLGRLQWDWEITPSKLYKATHNLLVCRPTCRNWIAQARCWTSTRSCTLNM